MNYFYNMKKLLLSLFIFTSLAAKAQTYFTKPGIPPGSISKSFTGRIVTNATDSLTELWLGVDGNKFWKLDLAAQTRAYFDPLVFTGAGTLGNPVTQDTVKKLIVFNPGIASVSGINNMSLSALSLNLQNTNFLFGVSPNHLEFINKGDTSQHYLDFNVSNGTSANIRNNVPIVFEGQSHIKFKNLPQGINGDSIAVWHNGILSRAVDNPAVSPNAIINGLNFTLVNDTTLSVSSGAWRIGNHNYSIGIGTTLSISKRDDDSSRYDAVYADTLNTIGIVHGVLSGTAIIPDIPNGTLYIGSILITPTGPILIPVNAYLPLDFSADQIVHGNGHSLSFQMLTPAGGGTLLYMDKTGGYNIQATNYLNNSGTFTTADSTGWQATYGSTIPSPIFSSLNMGAYTIKGKGIDAQIDDTTATFRMQTSANQNAIRADGLAFWTGNVVKAAIDSVKGTIAAANTIYTADGTTTDPLRTVTLNANALEISGSNVSAGIALFSGDNINLSVSNASANNSLQTNGSGITLSSLDIGTGDFGSLVAASGSGAQLNLLFTHSSQNKGIEMISGQNGVLVHNSVDSAGLKYDNFSSYKYIGNDTLSIPNIGWVKRWVTAHAGAGTVTAVSIASANGISGSSSGGATPALTIALQNATTSQSGQLTNTDWNTFNGKLGSSNFIESETPSGAINGSNLTYTLANTPVTGSVHLYLNGIRVTTFTMSTNTITWTGTAPSGTDTLLADYRK